MKYFGTNVQSLSHPFSKGILIMDHLTEYWASCTIICGVRSDFLWKQLSLVKCRKLKKCKAFLLHSDWYFLKAGSTAFSDFFLYFSPLTDSIWQKFFMNSEKENPGPVLLPLWTSLEKCCSLLSNSCSAWIEKHKKSSLGSLPGPHSAQPSLETNLQRQTWGGEDT